MLVVTGRGDGTVIPEIDSRHSEVEALYQALGRGEPAEPAFSALRQRLREALRPVLADRDVVVAHNVLTMPFNLPLAAALLDLGPVLAWTHDVAWLNPRYADWHRPGPPYELMCAAQPGARYVCVSAVRGRELAELGIAAEVIPNGIDEDRFLGVSRATRDLLDRAGAAGADPLVLVPLRITRRKRLELAIEATAALHPSHPGIHVVVTGPLGPHSADNLAYWDALFRQRTALGLDDVVHFLHEHGRPDRHPVSSASVAELYRLADAVLMPSESEGFGLPVIEAALARVPLACTDLPVLREAGGDHLHLFPVDAGAEAVAVAVEAALADPLAADRRAVRRRSTWRALLPQIEAVLEGARG